MAEKWEDELTRLLQSKGIISGDELEIPEWWNLKDIPTDYGWCDRDSWVGNYLISEVYSSVKEKRDLSHTFSLGEKLVAYLGARLTVFTDYVQTMLGGAGIELELNLEAKTLRYTKH